MLVDRTPQPMALALDLELYLIQMPLVARARPTTAQLERVCRAEFGAPFADCLVGDCCAPLGHELLNVAQAEGEAEVEPDRVSDNLGRVAMAAVQRSNGWGSGHIPILRGP
jgi:hypothetical protein